MKRPYWIAVAAAALFHQGASASIICTDTLPAEQPYLEKYECMEASARQAALAKKLLSQRITGLLARIDKTRPDSPGYAQQVNAAMKAKATLKEITTMTAESAKKQEAATDQLLAMKNDRTAAPTAEALTEAARTIAAESVTLTQRSAALDQALDALISRLAVATDHAAKATLIAEIKTAAREADKVKSDAAAKKKALVTAATDIDNAQLDSVARAHALAVRNINDANTMNRKVVAESNAAILGIIESYQTPTAESDVVAAQRAKRVAFLNFLENQPLLHSEVSGSGIQVSSTAGEGEVTVKFDMQLDRTSNHRASFEVSAPINKKAEHKYNPTKNNVLLDKLAGDTTGKLAYTFIKPTRTNAWGSSAFWLFGGSAEAGYEEFTYFDPATSFADPAKPLKIEQNDTSYALSAYAAFSPFDSKKLFLVRYSRQYEHKQGEKVAICPAAAPGAPYVTCPQGIIGAPVGKKFNIMSVEGRFAYDRFAFSTVLSYDRTSKVRALAVPFHFSLFNRGYGSFVDDEPKLTAGVIYGWRSDTKSSLGVFAGMPFSLTD